MTSIELYMMSKQASPLIRAAFNPILVPGAIGLGTGLYGKGDNRKLMAGVGAAQGGISSALAAHMLYKALGANKPGASAVAGLLGAGIGAGMGYGSNRIGNAVGRLISDPEPKSEPAAKKE